MSYWCNMEILNGVLDFKKVCRLCLSEETVMSSIYNEADNLSNSVPLPLRIMACVSVEVSSTDGLPSQICATCLCQVDGWYKFKELCENADSILRKYIKNEPVQVESIFHVQNMAQEVKKYCSGSQNIKEEFNLSADKSKKKAKRVEQTNGDAIEVYSLPNFGPSSTSAKLSYIKEEQGDDILTGDKEPNQLYGLQCSSKVQESRRCTSNFNNGSNNNSCEKNSQTVSDWDDLNSTDEYSSDDNIKLSLTKEKLLKEKDQVKKKRKLPSKKDDNVVLADSIRHVRTIQTQTGFDQDFASEVVETSVTNGLVDRVAMVEKKKRSRKTQTPKEKTVPKKRFRIRPAIPSTCTLCDKVYKNTEILRQHMKSHHVGIIECSKCKLRFTSLRSLKYHEQRKHSNLEPVPCTICGKKFLDKKYLRIHENIHSQTNQYVCQFCGRKFIMKTNLTVHISRHHTLKTNDFICQVCGKAFPFKLYLKKHFKTHTDYKPHQCNYCEAKFRENTLLRKHVNSIHLKLRPFVCQYCHKTFTRSLYLREHMESQHLGIQRKFECSRCGENFQNRSRLRNHECVGKLEVL